MLFTTFTFTSFFLTCLIVWWGILPKGNVALRKAALILMSCIFYAWADPKWLISLLAVSVIAYAGSKWIYGADEGAKKAKGATITVLLVGQLVFWKYLPWAAISWNELGFIPQSYLLPVPEWAYPVGLSFFTFHALSLVLSSWLEREKPLSLMSSVAHVSFFPSLLAGPVLRRDNIEPRWSQSWSWREVDWTEAIGRIMLGMTFKWVFASKVAEWSDPVYQGMAESSWQVIFGVHAYALQIFFDFVGYSHIALGVALMLGWRLPENFTQPYLATSVQDFWRHWHRSLSYFFRDYVYIHLLGGNRKGKARTLLNGLFTMFISGLWHGASATFVVWGIWHGALLMLQSLIKMIVPVKLPKFVAWLITIECVVWGWVWFRATDLRNALEVFSQAFNAESLKTQGMSFDYSYGLWIAIMLAFVFFERKIIGVIKEANGYMEKNQAEPIVSTLVGAIVLSLWSWLIMYYGPVGVPAFIYNGF